MGLMSSTPETLAATLAGLLADDHPVFDVRLAGSLPADAIAVVTEMTETLDDLTAQRDRLSRSPGPGGSVAEMVRRAQALQRVADGADQALLPLLVRLEAAGATLDLRPGLGSADPDGDPDAGRASGVMILVRPLRR